MQQVWRILFALVVLGILTLNTQGKDKDFWRSRSIYQVLTDRYARMGVPSPCNDLSKYCGGTFEGLKSNLSYIQNMGFDAIWISPVIENVDEGYHGFHAKDFYKINPHFGTELQLRELLEECHERNIAVMLHVVVNHVGPVGFDYKQINPFNKAEHYHDYCLISEQSWSKKNEWELEHCRLEHLPDLRHENKAVSDQLLSWIKNIMQNYTFDGVQVDAAATVPRWFWTQFTSKANTFTLGDVPYTRIEDLQSFIGPLDSVLNSALFDLIRETFTGKKTFVPLHDKIEELLGQLGESIHYMGLYIGNHNKARLMNGTNCVLCFKNAVAFLFVFPGIPIIYYGDEQRFTGGSIPENREALWTKMDIFRSTYAYMKILNDMRQRIQLWKYPYLKLHTSNHTFAFMRGPLVVAFSNHPTYYQVLTNLKVPFPEGTILRDELTRQDITVMEGGRVQITVGPNEVRLYVAHIEDEAFLLKFTHI